MKIRVVISGRSYHQASDVPDQLELAENASLDDALAALNEILGGDGLPASCLVALQGKHLGTVSRHSGHELREDDELVLISPVAGG